MYSKQESSLLKQEFWTTLGQYMAPIVNAEGEKINWINYKTGAKNIRFGMKADNKTATIFIELSHKEEQLQNEYFEKFIQLKKILELATGERWQWLPNTYDEHGKMISLIHTNLPGISIFDKASWPSLISFFKTRMIALDIFWCAHKYAFER